VDLFTLDCEARSDELLEDRTDGINVFFEGATGADENVVDIRGDDFRGKPAKRGVD
jgi:hypothetical protein